MQKSRTCPVCKAEWTGKDYVGERAAVDMKAKARERASTNGGSSIRPQSPTVIEDDESEEAEDEEQEHDDA